MVVSTEHRITPVASALFDGGERDWAWVLVMAAVGAGLSLLTTGYLFGVYNNFFHLPILARLYDEPQFRDDTFVQSLRYFAAGPFLLFGGSARYISPEILFPLLNYLSRLLTFVGMLLCARQLGVDSRRARIVFTVLISFTHFMSGFSYAGGGGLFIDTFTHSEIANGFLLISLYYASRGRFTAAFVVNGAVFFVNAFMAIWNAVPLGLLIAICLWTRQLSWRQVIRRCLLGLIGFAVLAAPVLWNILSNPEFGRPIGFDYQAFLREYWPLHFIYGTNTIREQLALGGILIIGALAFVAIGRRADRMQVALWGFVLVYAVGIGVPLLTSNPTVLNLHLLRSGVALHLLAALGVVSLATNWLFGANKQRSAVAIPLALSLCTGATALIATPFIIVAGMVPWALRQIPSFVLRRQRAIMFVTALLVLPAIWTLRTIKMHRAHAATMAETANWTAVGRWALASTEPGAVFMTPITRLADPSGIEQGSEVFEFIAHRRLWVTFRSGAAAMWLPSYYPVWHTRIGDELALHGVDERLDYARRNGISYLVDRCADRGMNVPAFAIEKLCVYPAMPALVTPGKQG